jgi:hypothetical protein
MFTLLIVMLSYTPETGPFMLGSYWPLAVVEMAVEMLAVSYLGRRAR